MSFDNGSTLRRSPTKAASAGSGNLTGLGSPSPGYSPVRNIDRDPIFDVAQPLTPGEALDIAAAQMAVFEILEALSRQEQIDVHRHALVAVFVDGHRSDESVRDLLFAEQARDFFQGPLNVGYAHEKLGRMFGRREQALLAGRVEGQGHMYFIARAGERFHVPY